MSVTDSKKQILKSTGILGSVQVINILIGILRVKILAVLLGPLGVGIAGIYQSTVSLIGSATGFGINFSGVRDIAAAASSNDEKLVARKVLVLRRWAWFTGLLGMLIALIFCKPLSRLAFGDETYSSGIAILSITLLLSAVTGGMSALLQGMRKIGDIAKANIIGSILGLIGAVGIYYFWGVKGIVPALLFTFLSGQLIILYFARRIEVSKVYVSIKDTFKEGQAMAKLGFFMVISALFGNGIMYLVRAFIVQQQGLASVGHFVAAWTISSMYISAIFSAMGTDYYPRLSSVQNDNKAITKLVNEQTEVALLLTAPIIIGMICFIDLVVTVFYSKDFGITGDILNWQLLGDFFKVLAWPMGYVLLAKAKGKLYILTELVWNFLFLGLIYFGWGLLGIQVSGIAFLLAYILNALVIFCIVHKLLKFTWSKNVLYYITFFFPLLFLSFLNAKYSSHSLQYFFGIILTLIAAAYSYKQLKVIIDFRRIIDRLKP